MPDHTLRALVTGTDIQTRGEPAVRMDTSLACACAPARSVPGERPGALAAGLIGRRPLRIARNSAPGHLHFRRYGHSRYSSVIRGSKRRDKAWRVATARRQRHALLQPGGTPGMQAPLRRVREAAECNSRLALASLEDLARLLALWRPGTYGKEREQAYLTARFGSQRPALLHPGWAPTLEPTHGVLLYADMWTSPEAAPNAAGTLLANARERRP
jgi:hypothetical protein